MYISLSKLVFHSPILKNTFSDGEVKVFNLETLILSQNNYYCSYMFVVKCITARIIIIMCLFYSKYLPINNYSSIILNSFSHLLYSQNYIGIIYYIHKQL